MHLRFIPPVIALLLPVLASVAGCTDSTKSAPLSTPDAGRVATESDAGAADAAGIETPPDAGAIDATSVADAADAAVTTTLPFATGLGANGVALADGAIDPHWTIKDSAATALTAFVQTDASGYPGYWMAPTATSKFISPFVDTVDPSGNGTFTYTTTFTLRTGVNLGAVQLVVRCASDNQMTSVTLNGQAIAGVVAGSYSAFQTLNVTSPFVEGTNTVTFVVGNSGGPTGLRAELDLTAN